MPGSLYARYVPPKKGAKPIAPVEAQSPPAPTVVKDSLYARYIPPKTTGSRAGVESTSKEAKAVGEGLLREPEVAAEEVEVKPKKRKRSEKGDGEVKGKSKEKKGKKGKKHKTRTVEAVEESAHEITSTPPAAPAEDQAIQPQPQTDETVEEQAQEQTEEQEVDDSEEAGEGSDYDAAAGAEAVFAKYRQALTLSGKREKKKKGPQAEDEGSPQPELHDLVPLPQPAKTPRTPYKATFASLPSWISAPRAVEANATTPFEDFHLSEKLAGNLARKGFTNATAVQTGVLPLLLPGIESYRGDICVSAPTGSGKTLSYVLPMIQSFENKGYTSLRGIIVVPTRELVAQARLTVEFCAVGTGVKFGTAVGSVPLATEKASLITKSQRYDPDAAAKLMQDAHEKIQLGYPMDEEPLASIASLLPGHVPEYYSTVDVLICTPGRLVDHINSTPGFTLRQVEWLVIDEADRLLDHNFQEWVDVVLPLLETLDPPTALDKMMATLKERYVRQIQKVILSATMTRDLSKLASLHLVRPKLVAIVEPRKEDNDNAEEGDSRNVQGAILPALLEEGAIPVGDGSEKPIYLLHLLEEYLKISRLDEGAEDDSIFNNVLIFTTSDDNATRLGRLLSLLSPSLGDITTTLTKSTSATETRKLLNAVRDGKIKILISTDRAARGLDLDDLTFVVNYDMPPSVTNYVHRVGRTARAGKKGRAWTLYTDPQARWFWKTIAEGKVIQRGERRVERMRFAEGFGGEELRERYQDALGKLGDAVLRRGA